MSVHMQRDNPEPVRAETEPSQLPGPFRALDGASEEALGKQVTFAQSVFSNVQELNRTMDQKANSLLNSVALLTAALSLVASRALTLTVENDWHRFLRGTGIALVLVYLLVAFAVIYVATTIYEARGARPTASTTAPGMLFPLMLLKRYTVDGNADETAYLARLKTLQPEDVLQDYSNQIVEVAIIYEAKQKQVNFCLRLFRWMGILWLVTMLVVVVIIVVLP